MKKHNAYQELKEGQYVWKGSVVKEEAREIGSGQIAMSLLAIYIKLRILVFIIRAKEAPERF